MPHGDTIHIPAPRDRWAPGVLGVSPTTTSCQPGQGGEGLSALARVAISVISMGWGQGSAARTGTCCLHRHTGTGAALLCPSRTNAADRVTGVQPGTAVAQLARAWLPHACP